MSYESVPPSVPPRSDGDLTLATWDRRAFATLIDAAIILGLYIVLAILVGIVAFLSETLGRVLGAFGNLALFGFVIWQLVVQGRTGATIGKKQLNLRVLKESDAQPTGAGLAIGRSFLHILDMIPCYVGFLWPLWDEKRQTFADKVVNTVVVDDRKSSAAV